MPPTLLSPFTNVKFAIPLAARWSQRATSELILISNNHKDDLLPGILCKGLAPLLLLCAAQFCETSPPVRDSLCTHFTWMTLPSSSLQHRSARKARPLSTRSLLTVRCVLCYKFPSFLSTCLQARQRLALSALSKNLIARTFCAQGPNATEMLLKAACVQDFTQQGPAGCGVVKSNFLGTQFSVLNDDGLLSSKGWLAQDSLAGSTITTIDNLK